MTEQERGKKMFEKGYRYRIEFEANSGLKPLYTKTLDQLTQLMREEYPEQKNWSGFKINSDGSNDI